MVLLFLTMVGVVGWWFVVKPEQIRSICTEFGLSQMNSELTYFRASNNQTNELFVQAYDACTQEHQLGNYSWSRFVESVANTLVDGYEVVRTSLGKIL
jgi:hypothetical protein